ncbi:TetR/AcrR family transcriptional regulator [Streptomyces sp. WM6378]|uniref:TetR/AcrR family transcriptional regulator n=1 Tax=Streptomyces sp. WM6378 TaxID=1415557 RepID=UPI0006AF1D3F|nr:TetR/AcrR family transcriptional regulator [Streptomyces sp. WM6378]KOU54063.1 TetR family transcriptional regulator [Streptomyces sp. WM6378]
MGHREDLLEGAKRCLLEKGYARTTARDIVAESGTNLASIGYHYGSKEALLNLAFLKLTEEWGDAVAEGRDKGAVGEGLPPLERFERGWAGVIDSYERSRPVWKLQMEIVSRIDSDPELQKALAGPQLEGRKGLAEGFLGIDENADPERARLAGTFYQALLAGVMVQWMVDPETAPSAKDLTEGLKIVMGLDGDEGAEGAQDAS